MKPETRKKIENLKSNIMSGFWWFVSGSVITMIIGFAWGGWTSSVTTKIRSDKAVLASQAAICVAQFMKEPNSQEKLKEFEGMDSSKRPGFIENGGWDKMPGQKEADYNASRACVAGLEVLIKK
jgi:hypothetical protein